MKLTAILCFIYLLIGAFCLLFEQVEVAIYFNTFAIALRLLMFNKNVDD